MYSTVTSELWVIQRAAFLFDFLAHFKTPQLLLSISLSIIIQLTLSLRLTGNHDLLMEASMELILSFTVW